MKKCKKCEIEKKLEEFVNSPSCKDGKRGICKSCWSLKLKKYYEENKQEKWIDRRPFLREYKRKKDKEYREKNKEILNAKDLIKYYNRTESQIEKSKERSKKYRKTQKAKDWNKKYKEKKRLKFLARFTLNNAVRDKKLERSDKCEICNKICKTEGHHHDYNKPLDVLWVCFECHVGIHRELKRRKVNETNGEEK